MREIVLNCLVANNKINKFMSMVDLFGREKVIVEKIKLTISFKDNKQQSYSSLKKIIMNYKEIIEQNDHTLIFMEIDNINGEKINSWPIYFNQEINTISSGTKYCLFKEWLEKKGYKVKTNQNMFVEKVTKAR